MLKPRIHVVDDEETIRGLLKSRMEREGYDVVTSSDANMAEREFSSGAEFSVLVTDLKMPGRDGFELMKWVKERNPTMRVIVITGHGEKDAAVRALREGASDYLEKPFDLDELMHSVRRCLKENQMEKENRDLVGRLEARVERVEGKQEDQFWYVSKAQAMHEVNEWLSVLRRESMRGNAEEPSVVIMGESGTGKEGIARMVHAGSRRGRGAWVAVNCANFNEQLLESELFGHERGAFTGATTMKRGLFELAKGGTLFLDEIGEMDIKLQSRLLRVLQEKVFRRVGGTADLQSDVRVIVATNRNVEERVKQGLFREDLFHRLCRVVLTLPGLRERREDVVPMAKQFAERGFRLRGKTFQGFTPDAESAIQAYSWPGNVRELLNVIERVALVWQGQGTVNAKALSLPSLPSFNVATPGVRPSLEVVTSPFSTNEIESAGSYMELKRRWLDSFEREYLLSALQRNGGNVSSAAREAQLDRSNFLRLLRRHAIAAHEFRKAA